MTHFSRHLIAPSLALAAAMICLAMMPSEAAARKSNSHGSRAAHAPTAKTGSESPKTNTASKLPEEPAARAEPTGVWTSGEQDRACYRGRRKLWQDGQGWVVKRVNVCP